jgi:hypothetical protein
MALELARGIAFPSGSVITALGVRIIDEVKHVLDIYLPDATRDGDSVFEHEQWIRRVSEVAVAMAGGCTILPTAVGMWRNGVGTLVTEGTTVVRVYVTQAQLLEGGPHLRRTLTQYRREADQSVVLMTLNGAWLELDGGPS